MRRTALALLAVGLGFIIGLVLIEIGANAYYFRVTHVFFYARASRPAAPGAGAPIAIAEAVFHPYFAFLNRPGRSGAGWGTNNNGFQFTDRLLKAEPHCCDYPFPRRPGEILVGIFGGSVADGFALTAQRLPGFVDALARIPRFHGKKIRVLNFAMAGYRQPQQLITLAYYLSLGQQFDAVIELDGFNEVVTSFKNWDSGVEPMFPADTLWGAWGRQLEQGRLPFQGMTIAQHLRAYHGLAAVEWQRRGDRCKTAACWLVARAMTAYHSVRERGADAAARPAEQRTSLFPTATESHFGPDFDLWTYVADRWVDSSIAMDHLLAGSGAVYLHVLQPDQWYRPSDDYRPIDPNHIYKWVIEPVNRGYDAIERDIPRLKSAGVDILDATMIFKGEPDRKVYIDDCCHYTDAGNEILFEAVADAVARLVAAAPSRSDAGR